MEIQFAITAWAACAPGLASPSQWRQWAACPVLPVGQERPAVPQMPPLLRRRLGPLGRMATQVAYDCDAGPNLPVVFASRYGDAARSLALLQSFSAGDTVSPTDFALSVHNAIGATYSIARRDRANFSSVAAGAASAAAAVVEAAGLLAEGAPAAMLVCYDESLPGDYAAFGDEPACAWAWAWRIAPPQDGRPYLSLSCEAANDGDAAAGQVLPFGLDVLRFSLSSDQCLHRASDGAAWTWKRHG